MGGLLSRGSLEWLGWLGSAMRSVSGSLRHWDERRERPADCGSGQGRGTGPCNRAATPPPAPTMAAAQVPCALPANPIRADLLAHLQDFPSILLWPDKPSPCGMQLATSLSSLRPGAPALQAARQTGSRQGRRALAVQNLFTGACRAAPPPPLAAAAAAACTCMPAHSVPLPWATPALQQAFCRPLSKPLDPVAARRHRAGAGHGARRGPLHRLCLLRH